MGHWIERWVSVFAALLAVPFESMAEAPTIPASAAAKAPMLLSIGERDFRVPINNTLENWATLQRMQMPSGLPVWPDASHWITKPEDSRHFYGEVHKWLATYLKNEVKSP